MIVFGKRQSEIQKSCCERKRGSGAVSFGGAAIGVERGNGSTRKQASTRS